MTLLAIFFPCIYFLLTGQLLRCIVCFILQITLIGWLPAAIWAVANNIDRKAQNRHDDYVGNMS